MLRTMKRDDERVYDVGNPSGTRLTVTGPHAGGGLTCFGMSVGTTLGPVDVYVGDQDDAMELARQILEHAGFEDVRIGASRELHEAPNAS